MSSSRARALEAEMHEAARACTLPDDVDHAFVDALALDVIRRSAL